MRKGLVFAGVLVCLQRIIYVSCQYSVQKRLEQKARRIFSRIKATAEVEGGGSSQNSDDGHESSLAGFSAFIKRRRDDNSNYAAVVGEVGYWAALNGQGVCARSRERARACA